MATAVTPAALGVLLSVLLLLGLLLHGRVATAKKRCTSGWEKCVPRMCKVSC